MTTATAPGVQSALSTLADQVQRVLRESPTPLTPTQVAKLLPPGKRGKDEVPNLLRSLAEQKELYHCGKSGKQDRYWVRDEAEHLRGQIHTKAIEFLADGPRTEKDTVLAIKRAITGVKDKTIKDELATLKQQKRLFDQPGKPAKVGLKAPDPLASLTLPAAAVNGLKKTYEKAGKAGASLEQFLSWVRESVFPQPDTSAAEADRPHTQVMPVTEAPEKPRAATIPAPTVEKELAPPPVAPAHDTNGELRELLLKAVGESGPGIPMPIEDLRRQLPPEYRDRAKFDPAVWKLVEEDKLYVVPHNYPAGLSEAERAQLLTDLNGEFYAYVAQHS